MDKQLLKNVSFTKNKMSLLNYYKKTCKQWITLTNNILNFDIATVNINIMMKEEVGGSGETKLPAWWQVVVVTPAFLLSCSFKG